MPIFLELSRRVPGWTRGAEAEALFEAAYRLPRGAQVVELGSFLGSGSILLAGARKIARSGLVHCVDPFDASGDAYSVPYYQEILQEILAEQEAIAQVQVFQLMLARAGLTHWVRAHQGRAEQLALTWDRPVDMIFMDADQSPAGVRAAFEAWGPWLKPGGVLALHNSDTREYAEGHDGHYRLRLQLAVSGAYAFVRAAGSISFFRKSAAIASAPLPDAGIAITGNL